MFFIEKFSKGNKNPCLRKKYFFNRFEIALKILIIGIFFLQIITQCCLEINWNYLIPAFFFYSM